jgi:ABC-type transport system involved in multi-copper enzyme maturation permease subunit
MIGSVTAELLVLRKRASTWILLGSWAALALFFAYLLPYVTYLGDGGGPIQADLADLLPARFGSSVLGGFPFFGGVFALMLGALAIGSEYGWGTLRTLFTQRPGRLTVFAAKLIAVAAALVPFVLVVFLLGAVASYAIAESEGATASWPSAWLLVRSAAAGWLIMAAWAALGIGLAVVSRGTALAIGIGILYALVIEGLLSAFADQVSLLAPFVEFFLRANAYSLAAALGVGAEDMATNGPGSYGGPFVDGVQALVVLGAYASAFILLSAFLLRRRDVA